MWVGNTRKPIRQIRIIAWLILSVMMLTVVFGFRPIQVCAEVDNTAGNKIHILAFPDVSTDAILLESVDERGNRIFGMVDSAEDSDYPDGSDVRYPLRAGTWTKVGFENQVIAYMRSVGVTEENFVFYIATHPHSDHVGTADEIIREFTPERVYLAEYDDAYINNSAFLWDNLYVYDSIIEAVHDTGARLIQNFDPMAQVFPEDESTVGNSCFAFGQMMVSIMNYDDDYKTEGRNDANDFCLGVLVEYDGYRAFLAGDINNNDGDEDRLASAIGKVNILKMGHHGCLGSSTRDFMYSLSPDYIVQTGRFSTLYNNSVTYPVVEDLIQNQMTRYYCADAYANSYQYTEDPTGQSVMAFVFQISPSGIRVNVADKGPQVMTNYMEPYAWCYQNGQPQQYTGILDYCGNKYYFNNSFTAKSENGWIKYDNSWYYICEQAKLALGWKEISGKWYYFDRQKDGVMKTGWRNISDKWYYLGDAGDGAMKTGWQKISGKWYYFGTDGAMKTSWQKISDKWYYFGAANDGAMKTGWQKVSDKWYYFGTSEDGIMKNGWQKINNQWYYLGDAGDGAMKTGWQVIAGSYYYFYSSGVMSYNTWIGNYYLDQSGRWTRTR